VNLARRRQTWLGAAGLTGGLLIAVGLLLPMPFVELSPGPTFNTIGEVDGKPLIEISGTPTYPTAGNLDMTTVNERGGPGNAVYVGRLLAGWVDPNVRVVPSEVFYPDDVSQSDISAENVRQFSDSESDSVAAALTYLGRPYDTVVVVSSVITGSPADGQLEPGDQILAVDGHQVRVAADVTAEMHQVTPGDVVTVTVDREGKGRLEQKVTTMASPQDASRAFMGIGVGESYRARFHLAITLEGVGGPSAGMMFSLGMIDMLTPGELNGGRFVAGTGTITPDGKVGPIGGIEQKLVGARRAGATLFLAPADNCADVVASGAPPGLTVARVATLTDAVHAVEAYAAGRPVTPCTR
jgi:PDZ domain-containing protein